MNIGRLLAAYKSDIGWRYEARPVYHGKAFPAAVALFALFLLLYILFQMALSIAVHSGLVSVFAEIGNHVLVIDSVFKKWENGAAGSSKIQRNKQQYKEMPNHCIYLSQTIRRAAIYGAQLDKYKRNI